MASTEILKLLATASVNLAAVGGHSHDSFTSAEVAAMLAGAPRAVMLAGYAKHVQDHKSAIQLACHVYTWAAGEANKENWKIIRGRPIVRNMSHLAVAEFIFPNTCSQCLGRGFVGARLCFTCRGSGHHSMSDRMRAKEIGVEQSRYSRTWRHRYEFIYQYVNQLESELFQVLRRSQDRRYDDSGKNNQLQAHQKQGIISQNVESTPQSLAERSTGLFLCAKDHA